MCAIPEVDTVHDDLARGQLNVLILNANKVAVLAELRGVKVGHGYTSVRKADEFHAIQSLRVGKDATAVDDGDRLVVAEQNLVWRKTSVITRHGRPWKAEPRVLTGTEIAIWATRLDFRDIFLAQSELLVDADNVLSNTQRSHAISIVRDTAEVLCALSGREGLPPSLGTAVTRVDWRVDKSITLPQQEPNTLTRSPVHKIGGSLCRPQRAFVSRGRARAKHHAYHLAQRTGSRACRRDRLDVL